MTPFSLNIKGKLHHYSRPIVMGIINVTDDSFYCGSRTLSAQKISEMAAQMCALGADIIDIGAYSSRPGNENHIDESTETQRLAMAIDAVRQVDTDVPISVDTFRSKVARRAVCEFGADIVNDISMLSDADMAETVAEIHAPYILMHMRGTPQTMQQMCTYSDVTAEVISELSHPLRTLALAGVADVIIDPGFGFAKTTEQNYQLLNHLDTVCALGYPVLAGLSRKSMLYKPLGITPEASLNVTTAANVLALQRGASILRVHDVAPARQAIEIYLATEKSN